MIQHVQTSSSALKFIIPMLKRISMKPLGICERCGEFEGKCKCGRGRILLDGKRRVMISKFLSGLLRHFPDSFGLKLDDEGWARLEDVLRIVGERYGVGRKEVELIVKFDPKGRFELRDDRIRAKYGHSVRVEVDWSESSEIPPILYHGTHPANVPSIMKEGLKPMRRREVHLSETLEDAVEVGRRHHPNPAVLAIDAKGMLRRGLKIRKKGRVYTTDFVPSEFIRRLL